MNQAQRMWTCAVDDEAPQSAAGKHDARDWQERTEGQNSNEIAAQTVAGAVIGRPLQGNALAVGAALVHYSFGVAIGALYGAFAARHPRQASGIGFGLAVWLLADEIAMPLLGLSQSTLRRPAEKRLQSIAAHLVFGMTTEVTRKSERRWRRSREARNRT